jgi:uncharacterized membrane protein
MPYYNLSLFYLYVILNITYLYMNVVILSAIILITIDSIYLYLIQSIFLKQITSIQKSPLQFNIYGAILCYILLVFGINYFILSPNKSVIDAFILGVVIYGVYETTNLTLFKQWSPYIVILDTIWGGVLFALTTYIVKQIK